MAAKEQVLKLWPDFAISRWKAQTPSDNAVYWQQADTHLFAGLRKVGLPEKLRRRLFSLPSWLLQDLYERAGRYECLLPSWSAKAANVRFSIARQAATGRTRPLPSR